ncbi:MAG TPA: hypothetical protein VH352_12565, partial [Pseudonocardiaceae bacterium]|nr:hypothetical protein [Pseudonocardiaceae bacterium]
MTEPSGRPYYEDVTPGAGVLPPRATAESDAPALVLDGDWRFRLYPTAVGGAGASDDRVSASDDGANDGGANDDGADWD